MQASRIDRAFHNPQLPPATEMFDRAASEQSRSERQQATPVGNVRGNLKSDSRWNYTWDGANRLRFIETSTTAITAGAPRQKFGYRYDYADRRYAKDVYQWTGSAYEAEPSATTLFYYDGNNLVYEARYSSITYSGGAPATAVFDGETAYYWGLDWSTTQQGAGGVGGLVAIAHREAGEATPTVRYPGFDGNGNLVTLLDAAGNFTASYEYGPYGEAWRASGPDAALNPFRFSTKYHDSETGLLYYGHRYYSPDYGRFLNQDPIRESGGKNLYAFVNNNPFNAWDYLGMFGSANAHFYSLGGGGSSIPYSFASDRRWSITHAQPNRAR